MSAEIKRSRKPSDEGEDAQDDPQVIPDSVLLKEIVPEEAWELVSKNVLEAGSEDHQNLVNSSIFFQNLWASERTTYLFEQVLLLVATSVWEKEGLKGFPVKDFLSCRQVCKEWNAVIDKVVPQFDPFKDRLSSFQLNQKLYSIKKNAFSWLQRGDNVSLQHFMRHFESTHDPSNPTKRRNPFIWGNVELDIRVPDDDDEEEKVVAYHRYLEVFSSMLAKYGKHVHSFYLTNIGNAFEPLLLRDWLLCMPNLVRFEYLSHDGEQIGEINLEDYQFPELRSFKKMEIIGLPPQVFNQLLGQNRHISELYVENPNYTDIFTVALPNLKKFKMGCCPDDIVEMLASTQVQWSLEALELKRVRLVGCVPLFQVIQDKFADTLVYLRLEIIGQDADGMEGSLWQDCKNFRLDLAKLKKIWLDLGTNPVCLDFLMPMKNTLEEIRWSSDGRSLLPSQEVRTQTSGGSIIQFSGFERKMLESNIWSILNQLKKVEIIGVPYWCYYRKDWMLKLEN